MQCKYRPSLSIKANDHDIQIHIWWQSSLWTSRLAHWFSFHLISVMKPPLIFFQFCLYLKLVGTSDFLSLGFHISFSLSYTQSSLWRESRMGHFLGLFDFRQIARTRKLSPRAHSPSYRVGDSLTCSQVCITSFSSCTQIFSISPAAILNCFPLSSISRCYSVKLTLSSLTDVMSLFPIVQSICYLPLQRGLYR